MWACQDYIIFSVIDWIIFSVSTKSCSFVPQFLPTLYQAPQKVIPFGALLLHTGAGNWENERPPFHARPQTFLPPGTSVIDCHLFCLTKLAIRMTWQSVYVSCCRSLHGTLPPMLAGVWDVTSTLVSCWYDRHIGPWSEGASSRRCQWRRLLSDEGWFSTAKITSSTNLLRTFAMAATCNCECNIDIRGVPENFKPVTSNSK